MKTTIALILIALAVIRTWTKWLKDYESNSTNSQKLAQLVVAITTTWAFYVIASDHIEIID